MTAWKRWVGRILTLTWLESTRLRFPLPSDTGMRTHICEKNPCICLKVSQYFNCKLCQGRWSSLISVQGEKSIEAESKSTRRLPSILHSKWGSSSQLLHILTLQWWQLHSWTRRWVGWGTTKGECPTWCKSTGLSPCVFMSRHELPPGCSSIGL